MKKLKQGISLLLAFCMCLSLCSFTAAADTVYTVMVTDNVDEHTNLPAEEEDIKSYDVGDTVTMFVCTEGPQFRGAQIEISYDKDVFFFAREDAVEVPRSVFSLISDDSSFDESGSITFAVAAHDGLVAPQFFAVLTFTVKPGVQAGDYRFTVKNAFVSDDPERDGKKAETKDDTVRIGCLVTFNSNGGSDVASQAVLKNTAAAEPTRPAREGYVFDGWYVDAALNTPYVFSIPVTGDLTLYAKWTEDTTPNSYGTPVWTWDGVTGATATFTCADGDDTRIVNAAVVSSTTATCDTPGLTTYTATVTFNGQTYTDQKIVETGALGHSYGAPTWSWTGITSAKAKFTCVHDDSHTVTVEATIASSTVGNATIFTATVTGPDDGTYTSQKTVSECTQTTTTDTEIKAVTTATVTDENDQQTANYVKTSDLKAVAGTAATLGAAADMTNVAAGTAAAVIDSAKSLVTGAAGIGNTITLNGFRPNMILKDKVETQFTDAAQDQTVTGELYLHSALKNYTLASSGSNVIATKVVYDVKPYLSVTVNDEKQDAVELANDYVGTVTIRLPVPANFNASTARVTHSPKEGDAYEVVTGEYPVQTDAGGTRYVELTVNHFSTFDVEALYTVKWFDGNGSILETDEKVPYGAAPSYDGATPTKTATEQYTYTFNESWSPAVSAVTGDVIYTAQFNSTINKYTVTFVDEDGETVLKAAAEYDYGTPWSSVAKPDDPTKDGSTFREWTNVPATVTENVTVKASYTFIGYTVTFDSDGGSAVAEQTVVANGRAARPDNPTRSGYRFLNWQLNGADYDFSTSVTGSITLKALWEAKAVPEFTYTDETVTYKFFHGTTVTSTSDAAVDVSFRQGESVLTPENVGVYDVYASVPETENFAAKEEKVGRLKIEPLDITGATITLMNNSLLYNGAEQAVTIDQVMYSKTIGNTTVSGTLIVSEYTVTGNTGTAVGDYTLTVTGTGNFTGNATKAWKIVENLSEVAIAPTALPRTYDGTTQPLVTAGAATNGTMKYRIDTSGEWSETVPSVKRAFDYIVYYKVFGDEGYADTEERSISVTVDKLEAELEWSNTTLTYNGSEQRPTATVRNAVGGDTVLVNVAGGKKDAGTGYTAEATELGNSNYKLPNTGTTTAFTINRKPVTVTANDADKVYGEDNPTALTATVDGTVDSDTLVYTVTRADGETVGSYAITPTGAAEQGNYTVTYVNGTFNIAKANAVYTAPTVRTGLTASGSAQALINAGSTTCGTMEYSLDGTTWSTAIPTGTAAGDYPVRYRVVGDANHNDVAAATLTVTIDSGGGTPGGGTPGGGEVINIDDGEVPLADLPIIAELVTPDENYTVTATRNDDGTIAVTVKDRDGNTVHGIPVRLTVPGLHDGEVAIVRDAETGAEIDLVEKSLVEGETVYALVNGTAIIDIKWNALPFSDVSAGDWFASATRFVSSHELFNGFPDGSFKPYEAMNRAMLVTVLWRLENKAASSFETAYSDVLSGQYYSEALAWGTENGIITGYDDGLYRPNQAVSRQEMALILYRYMTRIGYDTTARGDLSKFSDGGDTASWASEAVRWTVAEGIIGGRDDGTIDPWGYATRAEVAAMFQRLVTDMLK